MSVKLLTEHDLEFLSLKRGFTGSSESTLVKIPHCWKSHVMAQILIICLLNIHEQKVIYPNSVRQELQTPVFQLKIE